MPIDNMEAVLNEMEEDIQEAANKPVEDNEEELELEPKTPAAEEDDPEEEELDRAVANGDTRKQNGVFGKMRKELKEHKLAFEEERKAKQDLAERLARLEGRYESAQPSTTTATKVEEDNEPDRLIYPDDHRDWQIRQMKKENDELKNGFKSLQQIQQASQEEQAVNTLEADYKAKNPKESYDDAIRYLWEREKANKKLLNPALTDAMADLQIKAEKVQLFKSLYANGGRNGAEVLMGLAKNAGWKPNAGDGGKKDVDLKKLHDNQRRTSNLIGGSAASKGQASSDDILNMSMRKAMHVAHTNPSAFDGEYGES